MLSRGVLVGVLCALILGLFDRPLTPGWSRDLVSVFAVAVLVVGGLGVGMAWVDHICHRIVEVPLLVLATATGLGLQVAALAFTHPTSVAAAVGVAGALQVLMVLGLVVWLRRVELELGQLHMLVLSVVAPLALLVGVALLGRLPSHPDWAVRACPGFALLAQLWLGLRGIPELRRRRDSLGLQALHLGLLPQAAASLLALTGAGAPEHTTGLALALLLLVALVLLPGALLIAQIDVHRSRILAEDRLRNSAEKLRRVNIYLEEEVRKRSLIEARVRENEARLQAILDAAADGIITINDEGVIESFNPACERLFGYAISEALGENIRMLMASPYREEHDGYLLRYLETGRPLVVGRGARAVRAMHKDGREFPVEITINELNLGSRRMFTGLIRDTSQQQAAEQALRAKNEELTRRNEELDEFAQVASHDLQEPLRKLVSFSDLLAQDLGEELDETVQMDLDYIRGAASRLQSLVRDLLSMSRIGRAQMCLRPLDLEDCVDQALAALDQLIAETGAQVHTCPLPQVLGDATVLGQLFQNLLSNALKFSAPGRVEIWITCEDQDGAPVLGVRDQGPGVPEEYRDLIFAPFQRLCGEDGASGTGIGLTICRKAVERHGGRIWVEGGPDGGAHFRFTLGATADRPLSAAGAS